MTPTTTSNQAPSPTILNVEQSDLLPIQSFLASRQHADMLLASLADEREAILAAVEIASAAAAANDAAEEACLATENAATETRLAAEHAAQLNALAAAAENAKNEAVKAAEEAVHLEALRAAKQKPSYAEVEEAQTEVRQAEIEMMEAGEEAEKAESAENDARKALPYPSREDWLKYIAPFRDAQDEKHRELHEKFRVLREKERALLAASAAYDEICAAKASIVAATEAKQKTAFSAAQKVEEAEVAYKKAALARSVAREKVIQSRSKSRVVLKEHADAEVEALGLETERAAAEADDDLAALPDSVRTFSRERLQALTRLADWQPGSAAPKGWSVFYGVGEPPKPIPMYTAAAIIRGELPYEPQPAGTDGTRTNDEGLWIADFRHHALAMEVEVMLDQFDPDPIVLSRDNYDPDYVSAVVEPEFNKPELSLASIKPYPPSPVPLQKQAELIEVVRNLPRLRTWFLTGPPPGGSSKTALAYAYIKDLITQRLAEAQKTFGYGSEFNLCVYRIHAGKWMHEMAAWMTHDFHDYDAHPPQVNPEAIDEAYQSMAKKMGWKIVLLIDDLCKFDPNGKRNGWLHGIVDAITEKDGLIITTTNKTIAELARMGFDTATLSRLDGSRFLAEDRLVMDFHRYARR